MPVLTATASPSIALALGPSGLRLVPATAAPSIRLAFQFETLVVTDTFDRADNASSLGTADSGQVWSALAGTWGISSNKAVEPSAGTGWAVVESGVADAIIQATIVPTTTGFNGVLFRLQDTSNMWGFYIRPNIAAAILFKVIAGATTITDIVGYTVSASSVLKVVCIGSTIDCYVNGALVIHATGRTQLQTATKHGLYANNTPVTTWDDFSVIGSSVTAVVAHAAQATPSILLAFAATAIVPRTASPAILLALSASARVISTATVYTVRTTANAQGLVEPVFTYRGSP